MGNIPVSAAEYYLGPGQDKAQPQYLNFSQFPVIGLQYPYDADHYVPDSAATATAFGTGTKVNSNVIGLTTDMTQATDSIAEKAKREGKAVGILSTITLNHATPAAFYANQEHRRDYYEIGLQLADSNFDYVAGGSLGQRKGKDDDQKDLYEVMKEKGWTVVETKEEFEKIKGEDRKVYAVAEDLSKKDQASMPYAMDRQDGQQSFADMVQKGIEVLQTEEKGFFMMAESGKIDWAEHANDAAATIHEVIDFQDAIQHAIDFYYEHPEETLIVVTADHPTGGFTVGNSETGYDSYYDLIDQQQVSQEVFDVRFEEAKEAKPEMTFEEAIPLLEENFGFKIDLGIEEVQYNQAERDKAKEEGKLEELEPMQITKDELEALKTAFDESMKAPEDRLATQRTRLDYGGYLPLSITATRILSKKAGFAWTTVDHSPEKVPVYAIGSGAGMFEGSFDNTDIAYRLLAAMGLYEGGEVKVDPIQVTEKVTSN